MMLHNDMLVSILVRLNIFTLFIIHMKTKLTLRIA